MTMSTLAHDDLIRRGAAVALRTVTAAGLTVDAVVHLRIAGDYGLFTIRGVAGF